MTKKRCFCGGVILADTKDWDVPLCSECYEEYSGSEKIIKLEARVKQLEEALGFYADEENWQSGEAWDDGSLDWGKRARKALEE